MEIFSFESVARIGKNNVFRKVDALLDCSSIDRVLYAGLQRSGLGPQGYEPLLLFKCLLLGQWQGLSDAKLEESLRVRLDFMPFAGLELHKPVPDETTLNRFGAGFATRSRGLEFMTSSWARFTTSVKGMV